MMLLRHLLSILLLPFAVVVLVPRWLLHRFAYIDTQFSLHPDLVLQCIAGVFFLLGLGLFLWCVLLFARVGQGTLAPWDPTRKLVAVGPYRYVRNPMISGVAFLLLAEVLFHASLALAAWLCIFVAINHSYFLLVEEPGLEKRFGDSYREYRQNVPRWIPRLHPWS